MNRYFEIFNLMHIVLYATLLQYSYKLYSTVQDIPALYCTERSTIDITVLHRITISLSILQYRI